MGKSTFVVLLLEHQSCDEWEVSADPDAPELTNKFIEYLPFGGILSGEGEDRGVGPNMGPDFHLGFPTPGFLLPLCAPCLQFPWPLVEVTSDENGPLCSDPKHGVGLLANCSSPDKYGDGNLLCPDGWGANGVWSQSQSNSGMCLHDLSECITWALSLCSHSWAVATACLPSTRGHSLNNMLAGHPTHVTGPVSTFPIWWASSFSGPSLIVCLLKNR